MKQSYEIDISKYETPLKNIINRVAALEKPTDEEVQRVFRKYPKDDSGLFRKSDITKAVEVLSEMRKINLSNVEISNLSRNLRMKDTRTISGVTPITVLTKPFPCPGKCIFCPNDVRMPKSYLSDEPGAQRATRNKFDPYAQTYNRLLAYKAMGHSTDKIELIILGGTWTSYPEIEPLKRIKAVVRINKNNPMRMTIRKSAPINRIHSEMRFTSGLPFDGFFMIVTLNTSIQRPKPGHWVNDRQANYNPM